MEGPIAEDSGWEIWTIGPGGKDAHRWDRLFEIHGTWPADFKTYLDDLAKVEAPQEVWTLMPQPTWKSNRVFPKAELYEMFGRKMWFSSSISYCLALAIAETPRPTDIGLWGIDLESGEEYISQFTGCAHFIDLARVMGINIHLPGGCGLDRDMTPYPDRCETHLALHLERKVKWLSQNLGQLIPQRESVKAELHRQEGRLQTLRALGQEGDALKEAERIMLQHNIKHEEMNAQIAMLQGEAGTLQYLQRMYVWNMQEPQAT